MIDDDVGIRRQLRALLEQDGFEVVEYDPDRRGLKAIHLDFVDVLVTDIVMPDCDGFELLREIRNARNLDLPVVAYSKEIPMYATIAEKLGADAVVSLNGPGKLQAVAGTTRQIARSIYRNGSLSAELSSGQKPRPRTE